MKIIFIALMLVTAINTASAQIERKPAVFAKADTNAIPVAGKQDNIESRRDRMKDLDLTKEQRSKLKEIRQANTAAKSCHRK